MTLRELRKSKGITQSEAAAYVGMPLRTYCNYETDSKKQGCMKYKYISDLLSAYGYTDEENGLLTVEQIRDVCGEVLPDYSAEYCYLFGSYAKGTATPTSDVDLFISSGVNGIRFFELVEELRSKLKKRVDVIDQRQLVNNFDLTAEILKDGIKIYG